MSPFACPATPLERRARVIGRADLGASLASAAAAATAGVWYASRGSPGLGLAGAAILAVPLVLVAMRARVRQNGPDEANA